MKWVVGEVACRHVVACRWTFRDIKKGGGNVPISRPCWAYKASNVEDLVDGVQAVLGENENLGNQVHHVTPLQSMDVVDGSAMRLVENRHALGLCNEYTSTIALLSHRLGQFSARCFASLPPNLPHDCTYQIYI